MWWRWCTISETARIDAPAEDSGYEVKCLDLVVFSRCKLFAYRLRTQYRARRAVLATVDCGNIVWRVRGSPENVGDMSPLLGA